MKIEAAVILVVFAIATLFWRRSAHDAELRGIAIGRRLARTSMYRENRNVGSPTVSFAFKPERDRSWWGW